MSKIHSKPKSAKWFTVKNFTLTLVLLAVSTGLNFQQEAKCQPASNQESPVETESLSGSIEKLENKFKIHRDPKRSVIGRIEVLEVEAFGTTKKGSLMDRIEALKNSIEIAPQITKPLEDLTQKKDEKLVEYIHRLNDNIPYINTSKAKFLRIAPAARPIPKDSNYLNTILKATKNKVLRFSQMPIPVYLTPQRHSSYTNACIKGFEAWESRTNGNIRFVQVDDKNQARILVTWKQLGMSKDKNNCALGAHTVTKWKKRGKGKVAVMSVGAIPIPLYIPRFGPKYKVPPQIIEVNMDLIDSKRQDIKFLVLQNIVTHELGHALGILGHSNSRLDMMYPVTDEHSRISQRDLNTLSKLYEMKVDIPL